MLEYLGAVSIVSGPLPYTLLAVSGTFVGFLATQAGLKRKQPRSRRLAGVLVAVAGGAAFGFVAFLVTAVLWNPFRIPVPRSIALYTAALAAGVAIAVLSVQRAHWWRVVLSAVGVVVLSVTAVLASISEFGVNPTVGSLFGQTLQHGPAGPVVSPLPVPPHSPGIASSWKPPKDLPKKGRTTMVAIPATHSGFAARDAGLYLPPAALVKDPPRLPLVLLMMGQPGNPDPQYVAAVLDGFASRNHGLAPIVVVADQLGNPAQDPGCTDSDRFGKVETYITVDVLGWARQHLNVDTSGASTTVAGYSNGGACAMLFAAKYPDDFRNVADISGELFPGQEDQASMLANVFAGDQAAYDAQKPENILTNRTYKGVGIFTSGSDDPVYVDAGRQAAKNFADAGFTTQFVEIPNGGHVLGAINGGLASAFTLLYPRLGLQVPG